MRFNGRSTGRPSAAQPRVVAQMVALPDFDSAEEQSVTVTFPDRFPSTPVVTATPVLDDPSAAAVSVDEVTDVGFVLHASRAGGGAGFEVSWQAVEPTP